MMTMSRVLPFALAGAALCAAHGADLRVDHDASGFIRSVRIGDRSVAGGVGVYVAKPGWQGTVGVLGGAGADAGAAGAASALDTGAGTLTGDDGPSVLDYTWSIGQDPKGVRVQYDITPRETVDVEAVIVQVMLDVPQVRGREWLVAAGEDLRSGVFPETLPEPYSFFSGSGFDWFAWPTADETQQVTLAPDWSGLSRVTFQDDRQFGRETYEMQIHAAARGQLKRGETIRLGFTLAASEPGQIEALRQSRQQRVDALHASLSQQQALAVVVHPSAASVPAYGLLELQVDVSADYDNPFNPDDVALDGHIITPSGKLEAVPGFFWWGFERQQQGGSERLNPDGTFGWSVRYCPREAGDHRYWVTVRDGDSEVRSPESTFICVASDHPGMVRISPDNPLYFETDNRAPYFAVGENVCWPGAAGTYDYDVYWKRLAENGANYARIWVGPFDCFTLERSARGQDDAAGLGRIDLAGAWRLDYVLDLAEQTGIRVMFCIDSFNSLRINPPYAMWANCPYNVANGGPLDKPEEFFTNPAAKELFKWRLRYIVARWGHQPAVLSWEFWNEVDIIETYVSKDSVAWHQEMARFLRGIDAYDHLITTSWAGVAGDPAVDALPEMDYIQSHQYGARDCADFMGRISREKAERFGKPHYFGEFGTGTEAEGTREDTGGIHLHNGLWSGLLSQCAGTGMLWWWDNYVQPRDLYGHFAGLARFVQGIPLNTRRFRPVDVGPIDYQGTPPPPRLEDLDIIPAAGSWQAATFNQPQTVTVHRDGRIEPPDVLSKVLHGTRNHPTLHNPAVFQVDAVGDSEFVVHVDGVSGHGGANLRLEVDGVVVVERDFPDADESTETIHAFDGAYRVALTPGQHRVRVTNDGNDWVFVRYLLTRYRVRAEPPVRAYAMVDDAAQAGDLAAILWVKHEHYTWYFDNQGKHAEPVPPIRISLPVPGPGRYDIEEWDTLAGTATPRQKALAAGSTLLLHVSPLKTDKALKVYRSER